jgi:predicted aminopeptidase
VLGGCESLSYYQQAVSGHLSLMHSREPIAGLLQDPALDPALQERLRTFLRLRDFAATELALPVGHSYETLVRQNSPYVAWSVFAAPEFSLGLKQWCYPIAGCVAYRGYFAQEAANAYAETLREQGWEVYLGGVTAYSTLGWFDDPLLSSVLDRDTWQVASVLFHELAHQVAYAPGDSDFNESFATAVEQEGLRRWLDAAGVSGGERAELLQASAAQQSRNAAFVALVQGAVQDLSALYGQGGDDAALRQAKQARLDALRADYATLKQSWGGYGGYDGWFNGPLNNAQLATVSTYNDLVPAFTALLARQNGDLPAFYQAVQTLAGLDYTARRAALAP